MSHIILVKFQTWNKAIKGGGGGIGGIRWKTQYSIYCFHILLKGQSNDMLVEYKALDY
jgi:hypothetical protein